MRPTLQTSTRIVPALAVLLASSMLLDACATRRGRSSDDDDETSGDDDSGDDDAGDDDTGDDDTGDDDDSTGDDDDGVSPGLLALSADLSDFGTVAAGAQATTTLHFENAGGVAITATVTLSDNSGIWQVQNATVSVPPFTNVDRILAFNATVGGVHSLTLSAAHDGANASPQQLVFTATAMSNTEASCTNRLDDDSDGLIDCVDPDCASDSYCLAPDPCCAQMTGQVGPTPCHDVTVSECVCTTDNWCCNNEWDGTCVNIYLGNAGHCGGAATCP